MEHLDSHPIPNLPHVSKFYSMHVIDDNSPYVFDSKIVKIFAGKVKK